MPSERPLTDILAAFGAVLGIDKGRGILFETASNDQFDIAHHVFIYSVRPTICARCVLKRASHCVRTFSKSALGNSP